MQIYEVGERASDTLLIQPVDDYDLELIESEAAAIRQLTGRDFHLTAVRVRDWNRDLTPWEAPPVFGKEGFGNGAGETLREILELAGREKKKIILGGYSLAGLFALWAGYRTERFAGIAAASPSVWFPGFSNYMRENTMKAGCVYLSLGDREEKTRNQVMAKAGDCIREARELLDRQGICCTLEWNEGNHFREPDLRTARAFAWVMNHIG